MIKIKRILIMLGCLASGFGTVQAATVSFENSPSNIGVSDVFTLDIIGSAFPATNGGGVNFFYDATVLNVLSVSIDNSVWNFTNSTGSTDNVSGSVNDILLSAFPAITTGDFSITSIEFVAIGAGTTSLLLSESSVNPWAGGGALINPVFVNGSVTVTTVPVPAAAWLFGSGLLGLFAMRRRKTAS